MKNKSFLIAIFFIGLASTLLCSCKKDNSAAQSKNSYLINFVPAKTGNELAAIKTNTQANIIKTSNDFESLVKNYQTPLSKLSASQLEAFRSALVFREQKGIVSLNYGVLKSSLSADEFAEVMTYFGIDSKNGYWGMSSNPKIINQIKSSSEAATPIAAGSNALSALPAVEDHNDYKCLTKGTCQAATDYICLDGC